MKIAYQNIFMPTPSTPHVTLWIEFWLVNRKQKLHMSFEKNKVLNISYFKVFEHKFFILETKEILTKIYPKSNIWIFLRYSSISKTYRVFNQRTLIVKESMHIIYDEVSPLNQEKGIDNNVGLEIPFEQMNIQNKKNEDPKMFEISTRKKQMCNKMRCNLP